MHISTKERICTVCGGPGAAYHYQGMVCQSCRVFFVRTIRRKVNVPCRNGDNACEIVAAFRANCTACRFKKCLDANMKTGDVGKITSQHVRRAVVRYLTRNDYIVKINNFGALGCQMLTRLYGTSLTDFLKHMIHFEKSITNLEGTIPTGSQVNPNVSLAELLSNPAACAPRDTAAWNTRLCKKPEEGDYLLIHMYTRFCVAIADFFSSIMEFHQLSSIDKLKLAQYHIGHVGSLDCIFYQFKFGVETASCVSKTEEYSLDDKEKAVWNERCHSATSYFNTAADIFEEIVITHEEIILLKLLMIFFAPENLSEEGKAVCRRARGKYQNMLAKYVTDEYPLMNKSEQLARISRILEIYPIMQNVSEDTGQKYVIIINNNIGGMKQQLPHDIRIKVYTVPDIMPKLKLQQIVSASESDDKYGPKNLLLAKKWRGKAGAESNSVILRLEKEEEIRTIFIGNEGSAYISVAVAKSCEIMPSFNVLLSETAFMDPGECRMERNLQRVKSFDKSKLSSAFVYKKWDLIKVVCKQPYNKRIPFGICFITLIGGDENTEASSPTRLTSLGVVVNPAMPSTSRTFFDSMTNQQKKEKRKMEEEGREAVERAENTHIRREELMEKARQLRAQKRQAEVAIDAPSCSSANAIILDSKGRSAAHNTVKTSQTSNSTIPSRVLQGMINANNTTPTRGNGKKQTVLSITPKRRKNAAENGDDIPESSSSSPPLSGVHLTLSGFENPLRGELREKACELGAVYCQDVNDRLTHLVSAFKNTPKAKKCRSTVKLVSRHWIERCFVERRRLNEDLFKF